MPARRISARTSSESMRCSRRPWSSCCASQLVEQRLAAPACRAPFACVVGPLDQRPALDQLERDVEAGVVLLHDLGAPALEQIAPGLDRVEVAAVAMHRKAAAPSGRCRPARIGASRQSRSSCARYLMQAAIWSWPSQKMSASTSTTSPTTRLIACRPPSSSGSTRSITTRLRASSSRRFSAACCAALPSRGRRLQRRGVAAKHAQAERLHGDRLAGLERQRRPVRRDVLEARRSGRRPD